ncbi:hypothetical protein, partial [Staphylococcus aureus]
MSAGGDVINRQPFFKQKTAYEIAQCLVGSEMCIRDSLYPYDIRYRFRSCLLYTSDAADDTPCVDLGGRRIIKKHVFFAPPHSTI